MISEIRIPKLGMTQSDITVVELSRKDGDRVEKDEKGRPLPGWSFTSRK
jgi:pyruvate/2-oxoglutarate dehydrogenase complex dihydrolipoamide acyltransferase (E2) component